MAINVPRQPLQGLVDLPKGTVSREIFVNEEIYQQEQEQLFSPGLAVCRA